MVLNHHPHSHVVTHDRPKAASHPQWHLCPRDCPPTRAARITSDCGATRPAGQLNGPDRLGLCGPARELRAPTPLRQRRVGRPGDAVHLRDLLGGVPPARPGAQPVRGQRDDQPCLACLHAISLAPHGLRRPARLAALLAGTGVAVAAGRRGDGGGTQRHQPPRSLKLNTRLQTDACHSIAGSLTQTDTGSLFAGCHR